MNGRVVHFEIPFDDQERAHKFYEEAFGWRFDDYPELRYSVVQTGPTGEDGRPTESGYIGGGMLKRDSPADRPMVTIGSPPPKPARSPCPAPSCPSALRPR